MNFSKEELMAAISKIEAKWKHDEAAFNEHAILISLMRAGLEIKFATKGTDALALATAELEKSN